MYTYVYMYIHDMHLMLSMNLMHCILGILLTKISILHVYTELSPHFLMVSVSIIEYECTYSTSDWTCVHVLTLRQCSRRCWRMYTSGRSSFLQSLAEPVTPARSEQCTVNIADIHFTYSASVRIYLKIGASAMKVEVTRRYLNRVSYVCWRCLTI